MLFDSSIKYCTDDVLNTNLKNLGQSIPCLRYVSQQKAVRYFENTLKPLNNRHKIFELTCYK